MTERFSISVPDDVAAMIRREAEAAGWSVSTWVAHAARVQSEHDRLIAEGLAATREFEAEYGLLPPELREQARRELIEVGVISLDETDRRAG